MSFEHEKRSGSIYGKTIFCDGKLKESLLPSICLILCTYTVFIDRPTKVTGMLTGLLRIKLSYGSQI